MSDTEIYLRGSGSVLELDNHPTEIALDAGRPVEVVLEPAKTEIQLQHVHSEILLAPFGGGGGGDVMPSPPEVYVQENQPGEGLTAWYWFETDGAGNLTGNEYIYDPDGE